MTWTEERRCAYRQTLAAIEALGLPVLRRPPAEREYEITDWHPDQIARNNLG